MDDLRTEVIGLRAEVTKLRTELHDVHNALVFECEDITRHIADIYRNARDIEGRLTVVLHRVFPGLAAIDRQIGDCIGPLPRE